jgi:hypothetical protein
MEQQQFITLIEPLYELVLGTTKMADPRGKNTGKNKDHGKEPPAGGAYPVVLSSRPSEKRCEGYRDCQYDKTYSRTPTGWKEYCHECRQHSDHFFPKHQQLIIEYQQWLETNNK